MIDHIGIYASNLSVSRPFYEAVLKTLGIVVLSEGRSRIFFHSLSGDRSDNPAGGLWLDEGSPCEPRVHVAFQARSRQQVNDFYDAAMRAGGKDHGGPALRERYHPNYYAAFVLDPDGYLVEAVCHVPAEPKSQDGTEADSIS